MAAWCGLLRVRRPRPLGSCSPVCSHGAVRCLCGVPHHLVPVRRCARSVRFVSCAVSCATWLTFTAGPAHCVMFRVRCPGPLGSYSTVCPLGALCCVSGVLGHQAPVRVCARPVRCVASAVSWSVRCVACKVSWVTGLLFTGVLARCVVLCVPCFVAWGTWLLFTGVPAWCVVLAVRCPGPLGSRKMSLISALHILMKYCRLLMWKSQNQSSK